MRLGWFLLLLLSADLADGQVLLTGTVRDADTGQTLVAATIQVEDRAIGTATNRDGAFSLPIPELPVTIVVRHIGYRSVRVRLESRPTEPLLVEMEPDPVQMDGVVVTGEDPAVAIMRQVLAAKAAWRDTVQTAYAEVYSRYLLFREFDLVQMEESIGASWWRADAGVREITRARRLRPERAERFLYLERLPVPNLYDDEIDLEGTRFRGPMHRDALRFYRFRITEQRSQDGRKIHDLAFSPVSLTQAGFIGTLAVEDSTFHVLSMTARPIVDRMGPPPILERTVRLEQRFGLVGGAMVPVYFTANGSVRFGRAGVNYPRARFQQVSGLSLHATRVPVPDSLFRTSSVLRDDPAVAAGTWLFDWNPGMIPLSAEEAEAIRDMRPDRRLGQYFRPEGLLAQYAAVPISAPVQEPVEIGIPDPQWFKPWIWFNRVDGWHVGLKPSIPVTRSVVLHPGLAFAEAPDQLRWTASAAWDPGGTFSGDIGVEHLTGISGVGSRRDRFLTGLATYAGYDDYFDYYDRARRWGHLEAVVRGVRLGTMLSHEDHRSTRKYDDYQGWLRHNIQRENPPIEEGTLASATVSLTAGDRAMTDPGLGGFLDIRAETARSEFLGSDFDFSRWQGAASVRIPTLMRRRALPAHLRVDLVAGGGSAGLPIQRRGILDVATGPVADAVAFRSRRDARLVARRWFAVFWEHDFGSAISERIGLGETNLGLLVFGAHGTAWHGETTRRDELGIGWSKPFNLPFRVNLATTLSGFDPLVTVEYYGLARKLLRR